MDFLLKIDKTLESVENVIVVTLFTALVLLIVFNIVTRNLFGISFQNILELTPALVLWTSLLGATLGLKQGRHIKLDVLLRHAGRRARRLARITSGLFGMAVMTLLFAASLSFVKNEWAIFGPRGAVSLVFPLFFGLAGFRFFLSSLPFSWGSGRLEDRQKDIGLAHDRQPSGGEEP